MTAGANPYDAARLPASLGGAIEGMAIAAVLNAMTTRTSNMTILRIQGTGCELFLLHSRLTPERLQIEMSRTLTVIRGCGQARRQPGPHLRPVLFLCHQLRNWPSWQT